ncbi:MAG: PEP-CTERM system TPR-repeat protein PrsT [Pseudomonadales bacterium]|nr:PEP-CTERM system TPR-repeat protein PrsT [Pseudomonadales bacterium]
MKGLHNINFKRATKLLTTGALILGVTSCSDTKTDVEYLASAKKHQQQGDMQSYIIELKNAIQANPVNAEARYLMGNVHLGMQQGASAQKEFEKAIESGMPAEQLVDEMAQAYFDQYQYKKLLDNTVNFSALSQEERANTLFLRGAANLSLNQKMDAEADFESAVALGDPKYSPLSKAYVEAIRGNYDKANTTVQPLLSQYPDLVEAHVLSSRIASNLNNLPEAAKQLEAAVKLEPNRLQHYVDLARVYLTLKEFDQADTNIDLVLKAAPKHLPSNIIKATLKLQTQDWEQAKFYAEEVLKVSEVNKQAKLISGIANFHMENYELARERLQAVVSELDDQHIARRMLAYSDFKLGYSTNADDILENIGDPQGADAKLLTEFGSELAKRGDLKEAEILLRKAAEIAPEDTTNLSRLGAIKLQQQDLSGIEDLESVLQKDTTAFWARAALIQHYIQARNYGEAKQLAQELIKSQPQHHEGYLLLARVDFFQGNFDDALKTLNKATEVAPDNPTIAMSIAKVHVAQRNYEKARTTLQGILKRYPEDPNVLLSLYKVDKISGNSEDSIKRMESLVKAAPENDDFKLLYSFILADERKIQDSLKTLSDIGPDSQVYIKAQTAMGNLNMMLAKYDESSKHYANVLSKNGGEVKTYKLLITSYVRAKNYESGLATAKKGMEQFPNNLDLQLDEIRLLLANGREQQAKSKIARFAAINGSNAELDRIRGVFHNEKGELDSALTFFKSSHGLNPSTRSVISVVEVYKKMKKIKEAQTTLENWLKDHPNDQPARMYLANLSISKDNSVAIAQFKELLKNNAKNPVVLNNLAWALGEEGNLTEALKYASDAFEIAPLPEIADTFGYLLLKKGDTKEALEKLTVAHNKLPEDPSVAFHFALALKENQRSDEAVSILEKIKNKDFTEKSEASSLYKSLVK